MNTQQRIIREYNRLNRRRRPDDPAFGRLITLSLERAIGWTMPAERAARILDIACGEGALLRLLAAGGYTELDAFDLSDENVKICQSLGFRFVRKGDVLDIAGWARHGCYEVVYALDILEHLPKERAVEVVEAGRRCLAKGGRLVVQTPNMSSLFGLRTRYDDLTHEFGVTEKTAKDLMMAAGFAGEDVEVHPVWSAVSLRGRLRESYLRTLHRIVSAAEGRERAKIATKNLLIVAHRP